MKTSELFFDLPKDRIAQTPTIPRDHCKLMILNRKRQSIEHRQFFNISEFLQPGDVLVFNQSKVLQARLFGKKETGGKVEVLLLKQLAQEKWEALTKGKVDVGSKILFENDLSAEIYGRNEEIFHLEFNQAGLEFLRTIENIGHAPTPPYVKELLEDKDLYQTVYAKDLGSAAAPTAGLHFTDELIESLNEQGIQTEFVTLHVGLGTFQAIQTDDVEKHPIHSERYSIEEETYNRIKKAKEEGRRVIAVGTTSVRVLETIFSQVDPKFEGETSIFIYPGYEFSIVHGLITNFHTPYSSLLALVFALAGQEFIVEAYKSALDNDYRFFSFGDAMLIL